jgi:hypothetical protein
LTLTQTAPPTEATHWTSAPASLAVLQVTSPTTIRFQAWNEGRKWKLIDEAGRGKSNARCNAFAGGLLSLSAVGRGFKKEVMPDIANVIAGILMKVPGIADAPSVMAAAAKLATPTATR